MMYPHDDQRGGEVLSGRWRWQAIVDQLREDICAHLVSTGRYRVERGELLAEPAPATKAEARASHAAQRGEFWREEARGLRRHARRLVETWFAAGDEVCPQQVTPELVPVEAESEEGLVFRLGTLLWSVPVSRGYGRRMRFLVRDAGNGKLIGLLALGDPVFNLRDRDRYIGWDTATRRRQLVNVMDAFVAGAVPPYAQLLGGKVVTSLIRTRQVSEEFERRYRHTTGIISGENKGAQLALVTVTSALGRSSQYNRLRLPGLVDLERIGRTEGFGHFQIPEQLFAQMRELLAINGHKYATAHQFGHGPNWKFRVIREALEWVGLDPVLLRHGIEREIYAMPIASNWRAYLLGQDEEAALALPDAAAIGAAAVRRWLVPRAERMPAFRAWERQDVLTLLEPALGQVEEAASSPPHGGREGTPRSRVGSGGRA